MRSCLVFFWPWERKFSMFVVVLTFSNTKSRRVGKKASWRLHGKLCCLRLEDAAYLKVLIRDVACLLSLSAFEYTTSCIESSALPNIIIYNTQVQTCHQHLDLVSVEVVVVGHWLGRHWEGNHSITIMQIQVIRKTPPPPRKPCRDCIKDSCNYGNFATKPKMNHYRIIQKTMFIYKFLYAWWYRHCRFSWFFLWRCLVGDNFIRPFTWK